MHINDIENYAPQYRNSYERTSLQIEFSSHKCTILEFAKAMVRSCQQTLRSIPVLCAGSLVGEGYCTISEIERSACLQPPCMLGTNNKSISCRNADGAVAPPSKTSSPRGTQPKSLGGHLPDTFPLLPGAKSQAGTHSPSGLLAATSPQRGP